MTRTHLVRRRVLLIALAAAVIANIIFLVNYTSHETHEFLLAYNKNGMVFDNNNADGIPSFDAINEQWIENGNVIDELEPYLVGNDPESQFEYGSESYIIVQLPPDASADIYRRAITSLASRGICLVGIIDFGAPVIHSTFPALYYGGDMATVHQVVEVRDDDGEMLECHDRFNTTWGQRE